MDTGGGARGRVGDAAVMTPSSRRPPAKPRPLNRGRPRLYWPGANKANKGEVHKKTEEGKRVDAHKKDEESKKVDESKPVEEGKISEEVKIAAEETKKKKKRTQKINAKS